MSESPAIIISERAQPSSGGSSAPAPIFARSNSGFVGEGTEVMLAAEPGFTQAGRLLVPFRFQCPPLDNVGRTSGHDWPTYKVMGGADGPHELSRSEGPKLKTVAFKAMFLTWEPSWQVWSPDLLEPQLAAAELEALNDDGIKFRLRIRNASFYDYDDVNMIAVLTQADVSEEAGEPDTRYMQLAFQEWRPTEVERKTVKNTQGPWTHSVQKGSAATLYSLAQQYYKTNALWKLIAAANPHLKGIPPSANIEAWVQAKAPRGSSGISFAVKIPAKPATSVALGSEGRETQAIVLP